MFHRFVCRVIDKHAGSPFDFRHTLNPPLTSLVRNRSKLQFGPKEERVLEDALRLTYPGEEAMSPTLCASLAMEAVAILDKESVDDMAMLAAFKPASDVLAEFRDPMAVGLLIKLHDHACAAMRERGVDHLRVEFCEYLARNALANAVELCDLLYGKQHTFSILVRKAHQRGSLTPLRPRPRDK